RSTTESIEEIGGPCGGVSRVIDRICREDEVASIRSGHRLTRLFRDDPCHQCRRARKQPPPLHPRASLPGSPVRILVHHCFPPSFVPIRAHCSSAQVISPDQI